MSRREHLSVARRRPEPAPAHQVRRRIIAAELIDAALRRLHVDLLERGASANELSEWLWSVHWFPHLRHEPEILALVDALPPEWRTGELCEPQILLQFPHVGPVPPITFHVDREPAWAGERRYRRIVGVPLSPWRRENGGLLVELDGEPVAVDLDPGDAVLMQPQLRHSGGINLTGAIRYGVYFRFLTPVTAP
jgi:ectoine hydroxylase-related dioxygenase (phytanoyl-CoA dioxygenase family)